MNPVVATRSRFPRRIGSTTLEAALPGSGPTGADKTVAGIYDTGLRSLACLQPQSRLTGRSPQLFGFSPGQHPFLLTLCTVPPSPVHAYIYDTVMLVRCPDDFDSNAETPIAPLMAPNRDYAHSEPRARRPEQQPNDRDGVLADHGGRAGYVPTLCLEAV